MPFPEPALSFCDDLAEIALSMTSWAVISSVNRRLPFGAAEEEERCAGDAAISHIGGSAR